MTLNITSDVTTTYTVEIYGGPVISTGTITAGLVTNVTIPNTYFVNGNGLFNNRAIHVTALKPIVVYSFITRSAASAATLCLPSNVLGRQYYSANFTQVSNELNSSGFITIVAAEDNTSVEIIPTDNTTGGWTAGSVNVINLNKGQVYQVLGVVDGGKNADLTGTSIRSVASGTGGCKKIAVFSGSGKILIGGCSNGADNLYQQLYPVSSWGKKFLTVPSYNRLHNFYRIIRSNPAANVSVNGALISPLLFTNEFYQFDNSIPNIIESDLPITVVQYFTTQNCAGNGSPYDPDMIVLNPVEQNISDVTLVSTNRLAGSAASHQHNLHIIMRNSGTGISSFRFDGGIPAASWVIHPQDPNYSYLYLGSISETSHTLTSDSGFNALAYGYADFETYGYSAGTNVRDLNQQLEISTTTGIETTPSICTNALFGFKAYFPNKTLGAAPVDIRYDSMRWTCSNTAVISPNNFPVMVYGSPVITPDSINIRNTREVAWYSIPGQYSFTAPGVYDITITVYRTSTEGCGNEQEYNFQVTVTDPPGGSFTRSSPGCYLEPVQFTETTPQFPKTTYSWYWNFGDPASGAANISNQRNPVHTFSGPGNYTVKYVGITTTGCVIDTVFQQVSIPDLPNATISTGNINVCVNAPQPSINLTGTDGLAPYDFTYSINGVVQPVVTSNAFGVFTINNIPTNVTGQFIYKLLNVKNSASTLCARAITGQEDTVFVNPYAAISLQSLPATTNQLLCVNTPIANIVYQVTNGNNGVITGTLPPGVTTSYTAGVFTISGTPTVSGVYNFSVFPAGVCTDAAFAGLPVTITVTANATLSLQSGSVAQTVCINNGIGNIVYLTGGGATGATVTGLPPGVTYVFTPGTPNGTVTISGIPTSAAGSPFTYTVATVSSCINPPPLTGTITVNTDATITLSSPVATTNQTHCVNNAINNIVYAVDGSVTGVIVNNLPPGVNYVYAPGSPGTLTISGVPTTGNIYNYSVVVTGPCLVPPVSGGTITVRPDATIALQTAGTNNQTICVNTPATQIVYLVNGSVSGVSVAGLPAGMNYVYTPGNPGTVTITGSPTVTAGSPYNYTVTVAGPCIVPAPVGGAITVTPDATLTLSSAASTTDQTVCVNTAITSVTYVFAGSATGAVVTGTLPPGVTWSVTGNVLTIAGTPTVVSATPVVYNYTVAAQGPCFKPSAAGKITVNPDHTLALTGTNPPNQTVCLNAAILPISYTLGGGATGVTVAGLPAGLTYTVVGNLVTITGNPSAGGAFTVTTTGNTCKTAQLGGTITVLPLPTAGFTFTNPACDTRTIVFTDNSTPNAGTLTGWAWDFGDGNTGTGTPVSHNFPAAGTYNVKLTVTTNNGCSNAVPFTIPVTVNARPHADFNVPVACINDNVLFADNSTGTLSAAGYKWDFGDPASGANNTQTTQNGTHLFTTAGVTYNVMHIVTTTAGCTDTTYHPIFINGAPTSNFTVTNAAALCSNDSVAIVNLSAITAGNFSKLEIYWDFIGAPAVMDVDLAPVANKVYKHKYPAFQAPLTKPYSIRMVTYSGLSCSDVKTTVITLNATPKVQFNAMPDACYDALPFQITQASEIGGVPGTGTYAGPGVSATGIFTPSVAGIGTHTIKYTFTSTAAGCTDTISKTIKVLDTASAKFSVAAPLCNGSPAVFKEESTAPAGVTLNNTVWNFGDGSPLENHAPGTTFTHAYVTWGSYNVTMYNTSAYGCRSTNRQQPVYVSPIPNTAFAFGQTSVCIPNANVSFINNSTIADGTENAFTYLWNFGDAASGVLNTSFAKTPAPHHFAGTGPYTVTLTVTSGTGCSSSGTGLVNFIHPQPKTVFDFNKASVCIGDDVTMTDATNGLDGSITNWVWKFSDGGSAGTQQVTYTFTAPKVYDVSLYTVNSQGCNSDTLTKQFTVYAYPTVDAGPDRIVLEGGSITLEPIVTGNGLQYLWTPNTYLNNDQLKNPVTNNMLNDITYTLTVTGEGGCTAPPDKMFVKVLKMPKVPNTFTPNGDGINEKWIIDYLDTYPNCRVQVFTRTGQLVFESRGYKTPWDGRYNGKPLPFDTYYYILEPGNGRTPVTGYVTILK